MFKVVEEPTFTVSVSVSVPTASGDETETFQATFRAIDPEEAEAFKLMTNKGTVAFLKRVVVTLGELADANGKTIAFDDTVFAAVLKLPWARGALARAYFQAVSGAKAGN